MLFSVVRKFAQQILYNVRENFLLRLTENKTVSLSACVTRTSSDFVGFSLYREGKSTDAMGINGTISVARKI